MKVRLDFLGKLLGQAGGLGGRLDRELGFGWPAPVA